MSLTDAVADLVRSAPPDATIPVRWLAEQIAADQSPVTPELRDELSVDYKITEVARLMGRATSTIRTWCANGTLLGAYHFLGREWRVPRTSIHALQRAESARHGSGPHTRTPVAQEPDIGAWRKHMPPSTSRAAWGPRPASGRHARIVAGLSPDRAAAGPVDGRRRPFDVEA